MHEVRIIKSDYIVTTKRTLTKTKTTAITSTNGWGNYI